MNRFKPGDKARVIGNVSNHEFELKETVEIVEYLGNDDYDAKGENGETWSLEASELEPIEPVQEEESPWIDFEATEKLQFEMHKTVDMICEKTKVSYQDAANVYFLATIAQLASTISRLKSEIEELKRKA